MAGDEELGLERALVAGAGEVAEFGLGQVVELELELAVLGVEPEAVADRGLDRPALAFLAPAADRALGAPARPAAAGRVAAGPQRVGVRVDADAGAVGPVGAAALGLVGPPPPRRRRRAGPGRGRRKARARGGRGWRIVPAAARRIRAASGGAGASRPAGAGAGKLLLEGLELLEQGLVPFVLEPLGRLVLRLDLAEPLFEPARARRPGAVPARPRPGRGCAGTGGAARPEEVRPEGRSCARVADPSAGHKSKNAPAPARAERPRGAEPVFEVVPVGNTRSLHPWRSDTATGSVVDGVVRPSRLGEALRKRFDRRRAEVRVGQKGADWAAAETAAPKSYAIPPSLSREIP